ncbi:MAG: sigma-70 family RNA polymerase sigma factor [Gaiellaceae bacterium]
MKIDPELVEASTAESSYVALFDAHFADIWRFARRRCDSSHDADDVTAETFAVAWRRHDDVPVGEARLWLFGVARRVIANHQRTIDRQDNLRLRLAETAGRESPPDAARESSGAVREALAALPPDDRELLIMRAWDELSVKEMAIVLGSSPNAVSLRLYKARRKLAHELKRKESQGSGHVAGGSPSTEEGSS